MDDPPHDSDPDVEPASGHDARRDRDDRVGPGDHGDPDASGGPARDPVGPPSLAIPRGRLVRSRVVVDIGTTLSAALERAVTGYAVVSPGDALLLGDGAGGTDDGRVGVLAFEEGVPTLAYHAGIDAGGRAALSAFDVGPCRVEMYDCGADALRAAAVEGLRVPPGLPAERLANDPGLAERTRARAPETAVDGSGDDAAATPGSSECRGSRDRTRTGDGPGGDLDAVEAFLEDADRVAAIRERAREEAQRRAAEWGLDDHLA